VSTDTIFEKYWDALVTTAESTSVLSHPAVRLALRLAIKEASADQLAAPPVTWQREAESACQQIARLNEWLEKSNPALYHSPSHDTVDAVLAALGNLQHDLATSYARTNTTDALHKSELIGLRGQLATARAELDSALADVTSPRADLRRAEAMTVEQPYYEEQQNRLTRWLIDNEPVASLSCDNDKGVAGVIIALLDKQRLAIASYDTALSHAQNEAAMLRQQRADLQVELEIATQALAANGANVDPTPAPDWGPSHPAWQVLTAEEKETIAKLDAGEIKFRSVRKARRLILIGRVLRHIGGGSGSGKITMAQYNSQRPAWMAEASSITQYVESNKWQDVVTAAMLYTQTAAAQ
jgi:hypothetical protein